MSDPHPSYIDLHTHLFSPDPDVWAIRSFHQHEKREAAQFTGPHSIGLHPWYLEAADSKEDWYWIEEEGGRPEVVAIGEIGLDKLRGPELIIQEAVFLQQVLFAEMHNKPVIVHCVRAWEDLERIARDMNFLIPVIIHGFQKNVRVLERLLELGFYFSFGAALLKEGSTAQKAFAAAPLDRVFLETDESGESIQAIYEKAAVLKGVDLSELQAQIHKNCQSTGIYER